MARAPADATTPSTAKFQSNAAPFSLAVVIYVAAATMLVILVLNLFTEGFTNSLLRMQSLNAIAFTAEGYRDIQIYAGGMVGILCCICALVYGLYSWAPPDQTSGIRECDSRGCLISGRPRIDLCVIWRVLSTIRYFQIFQVTPPRVLGTYGPFVKRLFGMGITASLVLIFVLIWSTIFWLSIKLGATISRMPNLFV